jgi:hypothetical protein
MLQRAERAWEGNANGNNCSARSSFVQEWRRHVRRRFVMIWAACLSQSYKTTKSLKYCSRQGYRAAVEGLP